MSMIWIMMRRNQTMSKLTKKEINKISVDKRKLLKTLKKHGIGLEGSSELLVDAVEKIINYKKP